MSVFFNSNKCISLLRSYFFNKTSTTVLLFLFSPPLITQAKETLTRDQYSISFEQAITMAQQNDPWLTGNRYKQSSVVSMSKVADTLPDPTVSLAFANLPTNGFDFSQEAMTQFKVGFTQMFPRGDSLAIKSEQLNLQAQSYPFQRKDRQAKVAVTVGSLWLEAFRVQQSILLVEKNRGMFEQLVDIAQASYSSALGKTRQQDIIRAQLELTRLDDQLDKLAQQKSRYEGQLTQWLSDYLSTSVDDTSTNNNSSLTIASLHNLNLGSQLPQLSLIKADLVFSKQWQTTEQLVEFLALHPSVIALDKNIQATKTGVNLAQQKYQPQWGVNASYGYRDDDPMGNSRSDFLSIGVTFDLPLFTENRQDHEVKAAMSQTEAIKVEKILLLRELLAAYSSGKGRLLRLNDRKTLYTQKLLPQIQDQAEASLTAYTNDNGNFSDVVRARIAVLNAQIDDLTIDVQQQQILLELNYLFAGVINIKDMPFEENISLSHTHGENK